MGQGLSGLDQLLGSSRQGLLQGLLTPDLTRLSVPESVLNKARCCPRLAVDRRITSSVAPPRIAPRSLGEGGSESSLAAGQSSSAAPRDSSVPAAQRCVRRLALRAQAPAS